MMYQLFSFMVILIMNEKLFGMEDQFSIESFNSSQQRANTQHVIKLLIHYKKKSVEEYDVVINLAREEFNAIKALQFQNEEAIALKALTENFIIFLQSEKEEYKRECERNMLVRPTQVESLNKRDHGACCLIT